MGCVDFIVSVPGGTATRFGGAGLGATLLEPAVGLGTAVVPEFFSLPAGAVTSAFFTLPGAVPASAISARATIGADSGFLLPVTVGAGCDLLSVASARARAGTVSVVLDEGGEGEGFFSVTLGGSTGLGPIDGWVPGFVLGVG